MSLARSVAIHSSEGTTLAVGPEAGTSDEADGETEAAVVAALARTSRAYAKLCLMLITTRGSAVADVAVAGDSSLLRNFL